MPAIPLIDVLSPGKTEEVTSSRGMRMELTGVDPATLGGGTVVAVFGAENLAAVPVAVAGTVVCTLDVTVNGTQTLFGVAVASVQNTSEALGTGSLLTLVLQQDGSPFSNLQVGAYAIGDSGQTITCILGPIKPAAGTHAYTLLATSSSDVGNSEVPTAGAQILLVRLG